MEATTLLVFFYSKRFKIILMRPQRKARSSKASNILGHLYLEKEFTGHVG